MDNNNSIVAIIVAVATPLLGAIVTLAKKLYDAPRPDEHQRLITDCDKLKAIVDAASEEARRLLAEREAENRKLEAKINRLESAVSRVGQRGG